LDDARLGSSIAQVFEPVSKYPGRSDFDHGCGSFLK
jgi:hypothetical protein